ncbi:MAG: stage III sporulation protein AF [Lachnospiraceae bacterium]|nr:stage III sporulation protein AF [Lachnospiraceae bacterium]
MDYIKTIAVFLLITNLLITLINNENYQKYLKVFSGLILVLMVTKQVRFYFSTGLLEKSIERKIQEYEIAEMNHSFNSINEEIGKKSKGIYEKEIEDDIFHFLEQEKVEVKNVEVEMSVNETGLSFEKVLIELDGWKEFNRFIGDNSIYEAGEVNTSHVSEVRMEYVNQLIAKEYGIEKKRIHISD